MYVVFSNHAMDRIAERITAEEFAFPRGRMVAIGRKCEPEAEYKVTSHGLAFVCVRKDEVILILTVYKAGEALPIDTFNRLQSRA